MNLAFKELGKGKPLIILHGVFGSSDNWLSIGKKLAESFHVYIPDQRNHGNSFHSDTLDYEVLAKDLLNFINYQKIEKPVIIGHSMGGKAAMKFGVNHPDLFNKMVIVDIGPKVYSMQHHEILEGLNSIDIRTISSRTEADDQLKNHVADLHVRQFLLKNLKREGSSYSWRINLSAISENMERLGEGFEEQQYTDKPVLFIRGGKSDYILDQDSISIVSLFPNAEIVTIADAGHWVHTDKPQEFLEAVEKFIKS